MKQEKNLTFYRQNVLTTKNPSQPSLEKGRGKVAFTLAEVLITLGIIGVVAALTIPNLVYEHQKKVVETRLQKFYSTINQAIKLAELDYGDRELWYNLNDVDYDKDGKPVEGEDAQQKWINKYFAPYFQGEKVRIGTFKGNNKIYPTIYFSDGSALILTDLSLLKDWQFYPGEPDKCMKRYYPQSYKGKCTFNFSYNPIRTKSTVWKFVGRNFEPYKYDWDGTKLSLYNGSDSACNVHGNFCTALIQYNGWKIPDDYPFRVSY